MALCIYFIYMCFMSKDKLLAIDSGYNTCKVIEMVRI